MTVDKNMSAKDERLNKLLDVFGRATDKDPGNIVEQGSDFSSVMARFDERMASIGQTIDHAVPAIISGAIVSAAIASIVWAIVSGSSAPDVSHVERLINGVGR